MKNGDKPINPIYDAQQKLCVDTKNSDFENWAAQCKPFSGLTKREYFAGLAMQGLLASNDGRESDVTARHSVELAEALLAELEKTAKK